MVKLRLIVHNLFVHEYKNNFSQLLANDKQIDSADTETGSKHRWVSEAQC